jgi:hypothetical protein
MLCCRGCSSKFRLVRCFGRRGWQAGSSILAPFSGDASRFSGSASPKMPSFQSSESHANSMASSSGMSNACCISCTFSLDSSACPPTRVICMRSHRLRNTLYEAGTARFSSVVMLGSSSRTAIRLTVRSLTRRTYEGNYPDSPRRCRSCGMAFAASASLAAYSIGIPFIPA